MNYKHIFTALGLFGLMACNQVVDTKPHQSFTEELVWSNKTYADAFVFGVYDSITQLLYTSPPAANGANGGQEGFTPNGTSISQPYNADNFFAIENGLNSANSNIDFGGFGQFSKQRAANQVIDKAATATGLSEDERAELVAEGHFLRGLLWFDAAKKTGRIVPIKRVLTGNDKEAFATPLTANEAESYKLVIEEFKAAAAGLPETSLSGRANKYTALAFLAKAALQGYAYTGDQTMLDLVIESGKQIIASQHYRLTTDYGSLFDERSPNDPEIIFAVYRLAANTDFGSIPDLALSSPSVTNDQAINGSADGVNTLNGTKQTFRGNIMANAPTQDLVDLYLAIDSETGEAKNWYETSQFKKNIDVMSTTGLSTGSIETFTRYDGGIRHLPSDQDFRGRTGFPLFKYYLRVKPTATGDISDIVYANRDKRMDATIVRDKSTWLGENISTNTGGNLSPGIGDYEDGADITSPTGYYWRKGWRTDISTTNNNNTDYQFVLARLGEVYLDMAEAYLLKRDIPNAVASLNMTRTTHGGLPASRATTLESAWADYIRERRVEMVYEYGDTYYSYLRWGKYGGPSNYGRQPGDVIRDLSVPVYKVGITSDRQAMYISQLTLLNDSQRTFTIRRYLLPIPLKDIQKRVAGNIHDTQNPGW